MATYYWVGGTGNWGNSTMWSLSSGGAGGAGVPLSSDDVVFDANSDTGSSFVATIVNFTTANCRNFTVSGLDQSMTLSLAGSFSVINFFGSVVMPSSGFQIQNLFSGEVYFTPTGSTTLDTNGVLIPSSVFKNSNGTCTLLSNLNVSQAFSFNDGTFNLGSFTLSCSSFGSTTSNIRTFDFGTGQINLSGTTGSNILTLTGPNATVTGSANVYLLATSGNYNVAVGAPVVSFYVQSGSANITASASASFKTLDFTGSSGTVSFTSLSITEALKMGSRTGSVSSGLSLSGTTIGGYEFLPGNVNFSGGISVNGNYFLGSDLINPSGALLISSATFDAANRNVSASYASVTGSTVTMGSGTWSFSGGPGGIAWSVDSGGSTVDGSQATIQFTGSGIRNFFGGSKTYKTIRMTTSQVIKIYGSNTFDVLLCETAGPGTLTMESGTTNTFGQFFVSGSGSGVFTLNSDISGAPATIVKNNGNVVCNFMFIKDSTATGTSLWYAGQNSINNGGNTGWIFAAGSSGSMLSILRS